MTNEEQAALESFPKLAKDFCVLVESASRFSRGPFLVELAASLGALYSIAVRLPWVDPATSDLAEPESKDKLRQDTWPMLRDKFGALDHYWLVFDPSEGGRPVESALSQDLSEIYEDLRESLRLQELGGPVEDVYWSWRFDFREHWGRHAVSALAALHTRIRQET